MGLFAKPGEPRGRDWHDFLNAISLGEVTCKHESHCVSRSMNREARRADPTRAAMLSGMCDCKVRTVDFPAWFERRQRERAD